MSQLRSKYRLIYFGFILFYQKPLSHPKKRIKKKNRSIIYDSRGSASPVMNPTACVTVNAAEKLFENRSPSPFISSAYFIVLTVPPQKTAYSHFNYLTNVRKIETQPWSLFCKTPKTVSSVQK